MMELRLRPYHEFDGAVFRPEAGWEVPAGYGSLEREVLSVRRQAGMIDFGDHAKIEVTGEDRVSFLDGLVTADIKTLSPGESAYALVLNERSRVLGNLSIHALPNRFVLDIEASQVESLIGHFRKFIVSDDVELRNRSPSGHIEVHGPLAPSLVSSAIRTDVMGLPVDASSTFPLDKRDQAYATRIRTVGEKGFAIWTLGADVTPFWDELSRAGVTPFGRDAFEVLRIEAGVPRFGYEMSEETLALEVAAPGTINLTKGCYQGQEVVARGTYIGHMNRRLVGLRIDGDVPPVKGDRVSLGPAVLGAITSGAWSPTIGRVVAIALLRMEGVSPESVLSVDHDGWDLQARLEPLPFVVGSG